jgi:uncharacterized membrane protein (UPF0127 family)
MRDLKGVSVVSIMNMTRQTDLGNRVAVARSFWDRGRGLMFRSGLEDGTGLVIDPCSSIHTMWMRFPIDVLYVSDDGTILRSDPEMKPWRIGPLFVRGKYVIELPPGTLQRSRTERGDRIVLTPS